VSNYVQSTNFATKDSLSSGNPLKIVKGTEINTEFANIAIAVATKADLASPTFTGTPSLPTGTTGVTQSFGNNTTALATTAFVQAALAALYPVGSIYTNATNSTNPGTLLGFGTWTAFGAGRVMVGYDSSNALFDTAEETGGSADAITVSHTRY
jgi:ABC-type Co2+ transport system permease subunit